MDFQRISHWPIPNFETLLACSRREGFRFLGRLEADWQTGKNCFDQAGEGLYCLHLAEKLVAVGGINQDPYSGNSQRGRLRRFYVHPQYRGKGIGRQLWQHIRRHHQSAFTRISLRTDQEAAARFYEALGFEACPDALHHTHELILPR